MKLPPEHPLRQHLDAVATGQRPTRAAVDALVETLTADPYGDSTSTPGEIRRRLDAHTVRILDHARNGHSGNARNSAAAALDDLTPLLPTTGPAASPTDLTAIVDSIPREGL